VQNLTSFAQTSDGYLSVIQGQLGQLSTLAVRSTDGTLSASDRSAINDEFTKIRDQINNQIQNASFNGTNVFDTTNTVSAAVDASGSNSYTLSIANASQDVAGLASSNVLTSSAAQAALNDVTTAIQNIATSRSQVNADVATLSNTSDNIQTQQINTEKAASQISDADYAQQTTTLAKNNILNQASVAMLGQANLSAQTVLGLLA
jgi:flagellin